jgi:hypothetical protein
MRRALVAFCLLLFAAMAIADVDTRDKRASAMNVGGTDLVLPNPDGTISDADRAHLAGVYRGLTAEPGSSVSEAGATSACIGISMNCRN